MQYGAVLYRDMMFRSASQAYAYVGAGWVKMTSGLVPGKKDFVVTHMFYYMYLNQWIQLWVGISLLLH